MVVGFKEFYLVVVIVCVNRCYNVCVMFWCLCGKWIEYKDILVLFVICEFRWVKGIEGRFWSLVLNFV